MKFNFRVDYELSARKALNIVKTKHYDVIVTDYLLPDLNGLEFLKKIKSFDKSIPVIIYTGKSKEEVAITALNNGASSYIQKKGLGLNQITELRFSIEQAAARRKSEKQLEKLNRLYHTLSKINHITINVESENVLFDTVCRILIEFGKFQLAWIGLISKTVNKINPISFASLENKKFESVIAETNRLIMDKRFYGSIEEPHKLFVSNNIQSDQKKDFWQKIDAEFGFKSFISVPFKKNDSTIGCLNVYSREINFFDKSEKKLLQEITEALKLALNTIENRRKIKEVEINLLNAQEISKIGSWQYNNETRLGFCSQEFLKIIDKTDLEFTLDKFFKSIHDDDVNDLRKKILENKTDKDLTLDHRIIQRSGKICYATTKIRLERDYKGNILSIYGATQDVTREKLVKEKIKLSEIKYKSLFTEAPLPLIEFDLTKSFTVLNSLFKKDSSISDDYIIKKFGDFKKVIYDIEILNINNSCLKLFESNSISEFNNHLGTIFNDESIFKFIDTLTFLQSGELSISGNISLKTLKGNLKQLEFSLVRIDQPLDNKVVVLVSFTDLTEKLESEKLIKLLFQAVESSPSSIIITNDTGTIEYVNSEFSNQTGYGFHEIVGKNLRILKAKEKKNEEITDFWNTLTSGETWKGEFFNKKKNGEEYWSFATISSIKSNNKITHYVSIQEDITQRKNLEEQLKLSQISLDQSTDFIFRLNKDGFFDYVNEAALKALEYSKEDLLKLHISTIDPKFSEKKWRVHWEELKAKKALKFNSIHKKKSGMKYPVEIKSNFIKFLGLEFNFVFAKDITEQQIAHTKLLESEDRYKRLFEDAPISLWEEDFSEVKKYFNKLVKQGISDFRVYFDKHPEEVIKCANLVKVIDVNQASLRLFKSSDKSHLLGSLNKVFTDESIVTFKEELILLAEGKTNFNLESRTRDFENNEIYIDLGLSVLNESENILDKVLISSLNITRQKEAEKALAETRDHLAEKVVERTRNLAEQTQRIETIIETIPDGILVVNPDGSIILANKNFRSLFKKSTGEELFDNINLRSNIDNLFINHIKTAVLSQIIQSETIEPIQNFFLQIQSAPIFFPESNSPLGTVIQVRDVSSFIEFDNLRKQFVSTVSHELRTPITVISLSIGNLKKYWPRMDQLQIEETVRKIQSNSSLLSEMIEDLLVLSRIETKNIVLKKEIFPIVILLKEVVDQLEPKLLANSITINFEIRENIELFGDKQRIAQVLRNIVDNAIKYSHRNSLIKIKVFDNYIDRNHPLNMEGVIIEIIDSGIGIKEKDLPLVFDRFFRADNVKDILGTGLGLSICKDIIESHNGVIWVDSKLGQGSTFSIFLPYFNIKTPAISEIDQIW